MKGIADTGFLVAFANRQDDFHEWAVEIAEQVTEPLLTCDAVLAETAFHLRNSALVLEMVREGFVKPIFHLNDHLGQLMQLAERYGNREPDLADLCIIRLSELNPQHVVITVDVSEFKIYRRNRRERIPLLTPPSAKRR